MELLADAYQSIPSFVNAGLAFWVVLLHLRLYCHGRLFRTMARIFSMIAWFALGMAYTIAQIDPDWWCCGLDRLAFRLSIFGIVSTEVMRHSRHYAILKSLEDHPNGD